jgi:hypothetical protein
MLSQQKPLKCRKYRTIRKFEPAVIAEDDLVDRPRPLNAASANARQNYFEVVWLTAKEDSRR